MENSENIEGDEKPPIDPLPTPPAEKPKPARKKRKKKAAEPAETPTAMPDEPATGTPEVHSEAVPEVIPAPQAPETPEKSNPQEKPSEPEPQPKIQTSTSPLDAAAPEPTAHAEAPQNEATSENAAKPAAKTKRSILNAALILFCLGGLWILLLPSPKIQAPSPPKPEEIPKKQEKQAVKLPEQEGETLRVETTLLDVITSASDPEKRYLLTPNPNTPNDYLIVETSTKKLVELLDNKTIPPGASVILTIRPLSEESKAQFAKEREDMKKTLKTECFFEMKKFETKK